MKPRGAIAGVMAAVLATVGGIASAASFDLHRAIREAAPGSTLRVPAGVYRGPVTLNKPITLRADVGAILDGAGAGDVVRITAADVTLEGFEVRGSGTLLDASNAGVLVAAPRARILNNHFHDVLFGVYVQQAPSCVIRGNRIVGMDLPVQRRGDAIRLWWASDSAIEDNTIEGARDVVVWFSSRVAIRRNRVTHGRYGLHFMYADQNVLEDNRLTDNSVGAFLMYSHRIELRRNLLASNRGVSGFGLGLKDIDGLTATDNRITSNRVGIYIDNSPHDIGVTHHYTRNLIAFNDVGVAFMPSVEHNEFTLNTFVDNGEQVAVLGEGRFHGNRFTIGGRGNYWSDYAGFDADGDGIGDVPLASRSLFENIVDRNPVLRLFAFSPAQQAVEFAARAMPGLRPEPKFVDDAPLMQPVPLHIPPVAVAGGLAMTLSAAGLLLVPALLLVGVRQGMVSNIAPHMNGHAVMPPKPDAPPILFVENLTCRFGRFTAVDHLTASVHAGQTVAIWGHNGAGKSTAIKALLQLVRSTGDVRICGVDPRRDPKTARRKIGYVPQELCFYDNWSGLETLCFLARLRGVPVAEAPRALAQVGLADHARKPVGAMSGGMKQRLALAAALLGDPPLLLLDEMTSNLDPAARAELITVLRRQQHAGKAIVFSSHRLDEVMLLADRVLVMESGKLVRTCTPRELAEAGGAIDLRIPADQAGEALRALHDAGVRLLNEARTAPALAATDGAVNARSRP